MLSTNHRYVVGKFKSRISGLARQKYVRAKRAEARHIKAGLRRNVWNDIKAAVTELPAQFVLSTGAEFVKPCALDGAVVGVNRTPARESGQRLHVGVLFIVMRKVVAQIHLISIAELVIATE